MTDEPGSIIHCELHIPLLWDGSADAPRRGEGLHLSNLQRLQAIDAAESPPKTHADPPDSTEAELHRLETKLNLALDLLATLLNQSNPKPPATLVDLYATGARWTQSAPVSVGDQGRLRLYLHPLLAQPLVLPATILACEAETRPGACLVACQFHPMPDDLNDALLGFIFRIHRRAVAEQKKHQDAPAGGT